MKHWIIWLAIVMTLGLFSHYSYADTVAQATSVQGHKIRLTNERCTVVSGRSSQQGWGRTYSWLDSGITATGCGMLDGETVLIEWFIPPGTIDVRRYSVDDFTWYPNKNNKGKIND